MGPSMKEKFSHYFFYFMLYSIIGWIYEVFLEVVIYRWGYSNRSSDPTASSTAWGR